MNSFPVLGWERVFFERRYQMSIAFIWNEKYDVGNEEINQQHQYLFEIGNQIQNAELTEAGKYVMKMFKYTKDHFSKEEAHMKALGFPELEEHKELHEKLITKLSEVSAGFIKNQDEFTRFKTFVYEWLTKHILYEDKKYFDYSRKNEKKS